MSTLRLTAAQVDRACGVLLGSAVGDALGAGYEFTYPAPDLVPIMKGGGIGDFEPGEWTDDTAQAVAIARVAATGVDLRENGALNDIAAGLLEWFAGDPADVGIQTAAVLRRSSPTGAGMTAAAQAVHDASGRSAGNGSLMRTGPVALAYLDDPAGLAEAAMAISALTHFQDHAQEACAIWCLMIRHAVLTGELPAFADIEAWAPNPEVWRVRLAEAKSEEPGTFTQNGWAVGALQAAWSAITHTPQRDDDHACHHLADSLGTAIRIGHDTDTVAAIAGALLGARWGMSAIPAEWRRMLHGWPAITAKSLEKLAVLIARGGEPAKYGWPLVDHIDYTGLQYGRPVLARHPFDDGVWLSGATVLDDVPDDVDAVVSLCLTGRRQVAEGVEHIGFRLIDESDPSYNPNLDFVLADAARTVAQLRDEDKTVLLHCVAAYSRTPAVAIAYSMLRGVPIDEAVRTVSDALPGSDPNAGFRRALDRLQHALTSADRTETS